MNKQELLEKIKALKPDEQCLHEYQPEEWEAFQDGFDDGKCYVELIIEQLDEPVRPPEPKLLEPEKPVVPHFVADWYEEHKDNFEEGVYDLFVEFYEYEYRRELSTDLYQWFKLDGNKQIETLVKMKLFGYEIEKEKLYRAKNRHTGEYLCYCFGFYHDKNSSSENQRFTAEEKRWKELGYWNNDLYVFEEAEGEDE